MKSRAANLNAFWAGLIVEELIRNGVDFFCVAPGSRSSPLAVAVAENRRAKAVVHFDERGLAFYALGHARQTGRAAAIITTSGTAAANLFPAVVEASLDGVPMIVLTADRPPELRDTGANQAIDQVKFFGDYARWFFDLPCPDEKILPAMILTTMDQAVRRATGPVHLNCMFREPLAPAPDGSNLRALENGVAPWRKTQKPFTTYETGARRVPGDFTKILKSARNGLVVVGALRNEEETDAVSRFVSQLRWPVLPDVLSGLRLSKCSANVIPLGDLILTSDVRTRPDTILHLGGRILSKRIAQFVASVRPRHYVMVNDTATRLDPAHLVTLRVEVSLTRLPLFRGAAQLSRWKNANARVETLLDHFESTSDELSEPLVARLVSRHAPNDHALFLGNSMPIRDMNMFGAVSNRRVRVGGNRGASGIDGTIASGLGFGNPVTIIVGDLAALHDLNSLSLARGTRAVIIVLNNDGGGIFSFLPIAKATRHFEKYVATPHGMSFKAAAEQFGLRYGEPRTKRDFVSMYREACASSWSTLIEVRTDRAENVALHSRLQSAIRKALR